MQRLNVYEILSFVNLINPTATEHYRIQIDMHIVSERISVVNGP